MHWLRKRYPGTRESAHICIRVAITFSPSPAHMSWGDRNTHTIVVEYVAQHNNKEERLLSIIGSEISLADRPGGVQSAEEQRRPIIPGIFFFPSPFTRACSEVVHANAPSLPSCAVFRLRAYVTPSFSSLSFFPFSASVLRRAIHSVFSSRRRRAGSRAAT